jgi:hypothetical protein
MTSREFAQAVVDRLNELTDSDTAILVPVTDPGYRDVFAAVLTNPAQKPWVPYDDILAAAWFSSYLPSSIPEAIASDLMNDVRLKKVPTSLTSISLAVRKYLAEKSGPIKIEMYPEIRPQPNRLVYPITELYLFPALSRYPKPGYVTFSDLYPGQSPPPFDASRAVQRFLWTGQIGPIAAVTWKQAPTETGMAAEIFQIPLPGEINLPPVPTVLGQTDPLPQGDVPIPCRPLYPGEVPKMWGLPPMPVVVRA